MSEIKPIHANSNNKDGVYRLLTMVHIMAGELANSNQKTFELSRANSNPEFGPILTVWTNGIVDIEARTWPCSLGGLPYHEYSMTPVKQESV